MDPSVSCWKQGLVAGVTPITAAVLGGKRQRWLVSLFLWRAVNISAGLGFQKAIIFIAYPKPSGKSICGGLANGICPLQHDQMEQDPTEPHAGRSTFLLSVGGAEGQLSLITGFPARCEKHV